VLYTVSCVMGMGMGMGMSALVGVEAEHYNIDLVVVRCCTTTSGDTAEMTFP
jgi:hypothetical protein